MKTINVELGKRYETKYSMNVPEYTITNISMRRIRGFYIFDKFWTFWKEKELIN